MYEQASLDELSDFLFGHAQNERTGTGCTVICAPEGAVGGVDVRGKAPATRETDLLRPENMVGQVHAVVLSGGSAFGLEAASGVMDSLADRGIGFPFANAHVPIVCAASLFDLLVGEAIFPDKAMGAKALEAAFAKAPFAEGNAGAGTGATVGKCFGTDFAMKSGFGISAVRAGDLVVGACVAVNAAGSVRDADGIWLAGCRDGSGKVRNGTDAYLEALEAYAALQAGAQDAACDGPPSNTTIGAIVTNAALTKAEAGNVASATHDAYGRAIRPVHTSQDGDAVFALASGKVAAPADMVAILATEAMEQAIIRAIRCAEGAYGLPANRDLSE